MPTCAQSAPGPLTWSNPDKARGTGGGVHAILNEDIQALFHRKRRVENYETETERKDIITGADLEEVANGTLEENKTIQLVCSSIELTVTVREFVVDERQPMRGQSDVSKSHRFLRSRSSAHVVKCETWYDRQVSRKINRQTKLTRPWRSSRSMALSGWDGGIGYEGRRDRR
jgi:hypothetical protein